MLHLRHRRASSLAAVGVVLAVVLVGCSEQPTPHAVVSAPPTVRLSAKTLAGGHVELPVQSAKVTVVNLWASWCAPCATEIPALIRVAHATAGQRVAFVGLDERDNATEARRFAHAHGIDYPLVSDPDGTLAAKIPGIPPSALPVTVVLDVSGHVRWTHEGPVSAAALRAAITAAGRS